MSDSTDRTDTGRDAVRHDGASAQTPASAPGSDTSPVQTSSPVEESARATTPTPGTRSQDTPSPAVRVEVIANRSVQEDFFERLQAAGVGTHYTLFPEVDGAGGAGLRRGDHVWPEENFVYVAYVTMEDARVLKEETEALRAAFPNEGIRFFAVQGLEV